MPLLKATSKFIGENDMLHTVLVITPWQAGACLKVLAIVTGCIKFTSSVRKLLSFLCVRLILNPKTGIENLFSTGVYSHI